MLQTQPQIDYSKIRNRVNNPNRNWYTVSIIKVTDPNDAQPEVMAHFKRPGDAYTWAIHLSQFPMLRQIIVTEGRKQS